MIRCQKLLTLLILIGTAALVGCSSGQGSTSSDTSSDSSGDADLLACPDGLVVLPGRAGCVPPVHDCDNPWERPGTDGSCTIVGPRTCSRTWAPEAEVDCAPGTLLPCPGGFEETDDGVACIPRFDDDCGALEIPILGGGCRRIGPSWAVPGESLFDECDAGRLSYPGGGCVVVGPRACPQLWDPDDGSACVATSPVDCPTGWAPTEDGIACAHPAESCGPGTTALEDGSCLPLVIPESDCSPSEFPSDPPNVTEVVHVRAGSPCTQGCGSNAAPYPAIQPALDAVTHGGAVLLAEGTYPEGVRIEKPLWLVGNCAERIEITGSIDVDAPGSKVSDAAVAIVGADDVVLGGFTIRSPTTAVVAFKAKDFHLQQMEIAEAHGVSAYVDAESSGKLKHVWLHDGQPGTGQLPEGRGLWIGGESVVTMEECRLDAHVHAGIEVRGAGTNITLERVVVADTVPGASLEGGGLVAGNSAVVRADESLLSGNEAGGVTAVSGARVELRWVDVLDSARRGAWALGAGTEMLLERCRVGGSRFDEPIGESLGAGLLALYGADVDVHGVLLDGNTYAGVYALGEIGDAPDVDLLGSLVRGTQPYADLGAGVIARSGADVDIRGTVIEGTWGAGVSSAEAGTLVQVTRAAVRDVALDAGTRTLVPKGVCLDGQGGASYIVRDALLERCATHGVEMTAPPSFLEMTDAVVRGTVSEDEESGLVVTIEEGASGTLAGCIIANGGARGLGVFDEESTIDVFDSAIVDQGEAASMKLGAVAQEGGHLIVETSLVAGIRRSGLSSLSPGSLLEVSDSVVRGIHFEPEGGWMNSGVSAGLGGEVRVRRCLLEDNAENGIVVMEDGSRLIAEETLIRGTSVGPSGQAAAVMLQDDSHARISDCVMDANHWSGLAIYGASDVIVESTMLRGTLASADGNYGPGIAVGWGSDSPTLRGLLVADNEGAGIVVVHDETSALLTDSIIRNQRGLPDGRRGHGVNVLDGAGLQVRRSFLRGNRTLGIGAGNGTLLDLEDVTVLDTESGGEHIDSPDGSSRLTSFGDGIGIINGKLVTSDLYVARNDRTGIYLTGGFASGQLLGTVIEQNWSYGLVTEDCEAAVSFDGTTIRNNGLDLDCSDDCDVTASPGMVPVPEPEFVF